MSALLAALVLAPLVHAPGHSCAACEGDWRAGLPPAVARAVAYVDDQQVQAANPFEGINDPRHLRDLQNDLKLGEEYAAEIDKELKLSEDPVALQRVNLIGQKLAQIARVRQVQVSWGDP